MNFYKKRNFKPFSIVLEGFFSAAVDRGEEFVCYWNIENDLGIKVFLHEVSHVTVQFSND